jgi:hypothetical protein
MLAALSLALTGGKPFRAQGLRAGLGFDRFPIILPAGGSVLGPYPAEACEGADLVKWAEDRLKAKAAGAAPRRPPSQVHGRPQSACRRPPPSLTPRHALCRAPQKPIHLRRPVHVPGAGGVTSKACCRDQLGVARPPGRHITTPSCSAHTGRQPAPAPRPDAPRPAASRRPAAEQAAQGQLRRRPRLTLAERQNCLVAPRACGCSAPPLRPVQPALGPRRLPFSCTASAGASSGRNSSFTRCMLVTTQRDSNYSQAGSSWPTASDRQL